MSKCQCHRLSGAARPCPFTAADGYDYAFSHDPDRKEEYAKEAAERGAKGGAAFAKSRPHVANPPMRDPDALFAVLEIAAGRVLNARKQDATSVANALSRLVSTAMELLKTTALAEENRELKAIIIERWPEAKRLLKAVP